MNSNTTEIIDIDVALERRTKVERIKAAIAAGQYKIDSEKVARVLLLID